MAKRPSAESIRSRGSDSACYADGGLEYNFVSAPPDHLKCSICLHVLNDPHLTSCCGQHFCYSCITIALQRSRACPLCAKPFTIFRAQNTNRQVNALRVKCTQEAAGCEWSGELRKLADHFRDSHSGYVHVQCSKCGEHVQQRLFPQHRDLLCLFRVYDCNYCKRYVATYKEVKEQHWPKCDYFPVPCPNDCPKGSVPRNRLMTHLKNECKIKQQFLAARSRNSELSEQLELLEDELKRRDKTILQLESRMTDLQRELDEMKGKIEQAERRTAQQQQAQAQQIPVNEHHGSESRVEEQQWNDLDVEPAHSPPANQRMLVSDGSAQGNPVPEGGRRVRSPSASTVLHQRNPPQVQDQRRFTVQLPSPITIPGNRVVEPDIVHDSGLSLQWQRQADLPEVVYDGSAAVVGNFAYIGGGTCQRAGSFDNECTVFKYDYRNNICCNLPKAGRHKFTMISFRNQLVLVGGATPTWFGTAHLNSLLVWDDGKHNWDEKVYPPMQTPRMQPCAVSRDMYVIVAGGKDISVLDSVEVFDGKCEDAQWHVVAPLPSAIYSPTSAVLEGYWYIMGGFGQKKAVYRVLLQSLIQSALEIDDSDEVNPGWELLPDTDFERSTAAAFGNSILSVGGSKTIGASAAVRVYFPGRKVWLAIDQPLPFPFHSSVAVVIPGTHEKELLVLGGCTGMVRYKHIYKCTIHRAA